MFLSLLWHVLIAILILISVNSNSQLSTYLPTTLHYLTQKPILRKHHKMKPSTPNDDITQKEPQIEELEEGEIPGSPSDDDDDDDNYRDECLLIGSQNENLPLSILSQDQEYKRIRLDPDSREENNTQEEEEYTIREMKPVYITFNKSDSGIISTLYFEDKELTKPIEEDVIWNTKDSWIFSKDSKGIAIPESLYKVLKKSPFA